MTTLKLSLIAATAISLLGGGARAEEPRFGRLSDGRAYRVDNEGFQLVDHIAELEVTVDELNRQIDDLEAKLAARPSTCDKQTIAAPLPAPAPRIVQADCSNEVSPLHSRISSLESQLQSAQNGAFCNYQARIDPLKEQIALLQNQLRKASAQPALNEAENRENQLQSTLRSSQDLLNKRAEQLEAAQQEIEASQNTAEELRTQLAEVRDELEQTKLREAKLEEQISNLSQSQQQQLAKLQDELTQAKRESSTTLAALQNERRQRENTVVTAQNEIAPSTRPETRAMLSLPSAGMDLNPIRAEFKKRLAEIQTLVLKRKDLSDSVRGKKTGINISLQALQSSRGQSLDSIRSLIAQMSSDRDVRTIRLALSEIQQLLADDISTLERIRKL